MANKMSARGFDPTRGLTWTAETNVDFIKNLVRDRETLFAKHRKLNNASLQTANQEQIQASVEKDSVYQTYYARYVEFCAAVDIPLFPLSLSTIALFLFAKCSYQNGNYITTVACLKRMRRDTMESWKSVTGFEDLEDGAAVSTALQNFMRERKSVRIQVSPARAKRSSSKRRVPKDTSSDLSDDSDSWNSSDQDEDDHYTVGKLESGTDEQLIVPNLPQPGDRFSSADDLLVACYVALLPVYGNGASLAKTKSITVECSRSQYKPGSDRDGRCNWRIGAVTDEKTKEVVVSAQMSRLFHNHGRSAGIIKDPNYRPTVKHPLVRRALGLFPLEPLNKTQTPSKLDEQSSKKLKYTPHQINSSQISKYSPYSSMLTHSSTNVQSNSQISNSSHFAHYPQIASSSTTSLAPPFPAHGFSMPQSHSAFALPTVLASTSLAQSAAPPLSPFFPQLERFLRALHPSLSALAIPLFNAGIDSFELLCLFNAFESETLAKFLQLVKSQDVKQEISNVHLRLLQKKLEEAKAGEWND
ncbi:hypothetical protein JCM5353_007904 [Sporobolomyces roseus]